MNYYELGNTLKEFETKVEEINGLYIDSNVAIMMYNKYINAAMKKSSNESTVSMGPNDPNDPNKIIQHETTVGVLKERTKKRGQDIRVITNLCLIAIYQLWEDEYRSRISLLLGNKDKSSLKSDLFGDLGIIRSAIIHNNSKKISKFSKLKILLYMKDRKKIYFTENEFDKLIELIKKEISKIGISQ